MPRTIVHLVRHGEVHNPDGVLYGRLPTYRLSERGQAMARRVAERLVADPRADVVTVVSSPLQRAQETAAPIAAEYGLDVRSDDRLIEAGNRLEGMRLGQGMRGVLRWEVLRHAGNPFRPSWGEPYVEQKQRMFAAIDDARRRAAGHEAVLVSHQSPIWITRLAIAGRPLWHDLRARQCALASVTSLTFDGATLVAHDYAEPAADLIGATAQVPGA
ncbi:Phosphoglycerate mutase [Beutenbergia cavernae DSM 12333]|uniref:Phosphoglycerate mutase n=1 Tax=Beutenbergia cavernae (strain ATCC BAA-8 / DSM 12333 / CCUG 43141 / JCM 11478 / NBRC 16432 / NCIMB 13614 / HKI 0122) TaxID=471853 RepID=C5C188_BEUC1|nr:histidine phosphatase family protein [Beutenbergia cavernae]ACQ81498.1 Phosphoglycerate mutase [Beutenbergia cavernae DSM 12333]